MATGLHVSFDQPQQALTPGQFIALYDGERCLGGGAIAATVA
jgi:tRNA-uridine 2-sulfurtransferase